MNYEHCIMNDRIYLFLCTNKNKNDVSAKGAMWDKDIWNPYLSCYGSWFVPSNTEDMSPFEDYLPQTQGAGNSSLSYVTGKEKDASYFIALQNAKQYLRNHFKEGTLYGFLMFYLNVLDLDVYDAVTTYHQQPNATAVGTMIWWNQRGYRVKNGKRMMVYSVSSSMETFVGKNIMRRAERALKETSVFMVGDFCISKNKDDTFTLSQMSFDDLECYHEVIANNVPFREICATLKSEEGKVFVSKGCTVNGMTQDGVIKDDTLPVLVPFTSLSNPFQMKEDSHVRLVFAVLSQMTDYEIIYKDEYSQKRKLLFLAPDTKPIVAVKRLLKVISSQFFEGDKDAPSFMQEAVFAMLCSYFSIPVGDEESVLAHHNLMHYAHDVSNDRLREAIEDIRYHMLSWVTKFLRLSAKENRDQILSCEGYHAPFFLETQDGQTKETDMETEKSSYPTFLLHGHTGDASPDSLPIEDDASFMAKDEVEQKIEESFQEEEETKTPKEENDATKRKEPDDNPSVKEVDVSDLDDALLLGMEGTDDPKEDLDTAKAKNSPVYASSEGDNAIVYNGEDSEEKILVKNVYLNIKHQGLIDPVNNPYRFEYGLVRLGKNGVFLSFNPVIKSMRSMGDGATVFTLMGEDVGFMKLADENASSDFYENLEPLDTGDYDFQYFLKHSTLKVTAFDGEIFCDDNGVDINAVSRFCIDSFYVEFDNLSHINFGYDYVVWGHDWAKPEGLRKEEKPLPKTPINATGGAKAQEPSSYHTSELQSLSADDSVEQGGNLTLSALGRRRSVPLPTNIHDARRQTSEKELFGTGERTPLEEENKEGFLPLLGFDIHNFAQVEEASLKQGVEDRMEHEIPLLSYEKACEQLLLFKQLSSKLSKNRVASFYNVWKTGWLQADRLLYNKITLDEWNLTRLICVSVFDEQKGLEKNSIATFHEFFHGFAQDIELDEKKKEILEQVKQNIWDNPMRFYDIKKHSLIYTIASAPALQGKSLEVACADDVTKLYDTAFVKDFLSGLYRRKGKGILSQNDFSKHSKLTNRILSYLNIDLDDYNDKTVNFYVAECGEFPSMGLYRDGLSFSEAVELFMRLDDNEYYGKAIGVTIESATAVPFEAQLYPLNFTATQMQPFKSNKTVQESISFIATKMRLKEIFDSKKKFLGEPLPTRDLKSRDNVTVDIYQLKDDKQKVYKWRDYNYLIYTMKKDISIENYNKVVSFTLKEVNQMETLLSKLFTMGNIRKDRFEAYILEGQRFNNISVGDVIVLTTKDYFNPNVFVQSIAYYVNTNGFVKLTNFTGRKRGCLVKKKKSRLFETYRETYDLDPALAVLEASQSIGMDISEMEARVIASIDGMVLQVPRDEKQLKTYLLKGKDMAVSILKKQCPVCVQIACSRYPLLHGTQVYTITEFDRLIAQEKVAVKKYFLEYGNNSFVGDDEIRLNVMYFMQDERGEFRVCTMPMVFYISDMRFPDFISNVESVINAMVLNAKEAIEMGKIFGVPLTGDKKIELKDAVKGLSALASAINSVAKKNAKKNEALQKEAVG